MVNHQNVNTQKLSDSILWSSLLAGDETSFSLLFERYYASLIRYGNTLIPISERVKDSVQDVFVEIWIYRKTLCESVIVKAYLLSCVRKRIVRLQERDSVFRKSTSLDDIDFLFDFSVEEELISDETMASKVNHLNDLLNNLSARQKEALYLRYYSGLSIEQISEILDVNYQSVKNLLHRALLQLRKEWKYSTAMFFTLFSQIC